METRWYRQKTAIELGCMECNKSFTPNSEFMLLHYACALPYNEIVEKLREFLRANPNPDLQKILDDFDGRRKEKDGS